MNENEKSCAKILGQTSNGIQVSATAGRISTTEGTAFSVFNKGEDNNEANVKLISKVLGSGHKTIIEHHNFSIGFNNVSIIVEQFLIEFRLTSFTIKSRRYVDFSNAGYYMPEIEKISDRDLFENTTKNLFASYKELMDKGLIKEDARFILPYNFNSNILMSCNARELMHIICTMIYGRGRDYSEIYNLGIQLKEQFDEIYPDIIEKEKFKYEKYHSIKASPITINPQNIAYVDSEVELVSNTENIDKVINTALQIENLENFDIKQLITDGKLARVLEQINFTFAIKNITLASLTHITRHRIHSLIVPNLQTIINENKYKIAPNILENEEYLEIYKKAIEETNKTILNLKHLDPQTLSYLYVSGRTIDIMTTMNARELLWFFKLRTCDRAQWEIRDIAKQMLKLVKNKFPNIFKLFGPSCLVEGFCPEGRLTCGKLKTEDDF